jgi:hypothetical protein
MLLEVAMYMVLFILFVFSDTKIIFLWLYIIKTIFAFLK